MSKYANINIINSYIKAKYEKKMTEMFAEIFRATPLCHVINNEAGSPKPVLLLLLCI